MSSSLRRIASRVASGALASSSSAPASSAGAAAPCLSLLLPGNASAFAGATVFLESDAAVGLGRRDFASATPQWPPAGVEPSPFMKTDKVSGGRRCMASVSQ